MYICKGRTMKLKDCTTINLPTFSDSRGSLTLMDSATASKILPFIPKRWFWIHNVNTTAQRGQHAHRTCWECVLAISGQFKLTLHDGNEQKTFTMNSPSQGIIIPPMVWCKLWDFEPGTVCLTMASEDYDTAGYINDFETFLNETSHD